MGASNKIDPSRMMGSAAFKREINHLLYAGHVSGPGADNDLGWNGREHALVIALMLRHGDKNPKIASGKCMYVQGPVSGNAAFGIGQEIYHKTGHNWLVHAKFGLIDLSPTLQNREHHFRDSFNGILNRVWMPPGKERSSVVVCTDEARYERAIDRARRAMAHSTAIYLHLDDTGVSAKLIKSPFKFLHSRLSSEIKQRFGAEFYPAVAKHLHDFVLGKADTLVKQGKVQAWGAVVDSYMASLPSGA